MPRTNKKTRQARKRKRAESLSKIPYQVLARDKEIMINPGVDLAVPWVLSSAIVNQRTIQTTEIFGKI